MTLIEVTKECDEPAVEPSTISHPSELPANLAVELCPQPPGQT